MNLMIRMIIIHALALIAFCNYCAASSDDPIISYEKDFYNVVEDYKNEIFPYMQQNERQIANSIIFKFSKSEYMFARAYYGEAKSRIVEMSLGFMIAMAEVSRAMYFSSIAGRSQCMMSYFSAAGEVAKNNYLAAQRGLPLRKAVSDFVTFSRSNELCDSMSHVVSNINTVKLVNGIITLCIKIALGHEIAHHVLGHVGVMPGSKAESRRDEHNADVWSIRVGLTAQGWPAVAIIPTFFAYSLTYPDIREDPFSTHPHPFDRILTSIDLTIEYFERPSSLKLPGNWIEELKAAKRSLEPILLEIKLHG